MKRIVDIGCISHRYPDSTEVRICGLEFFMYEKEVVGLLGGNGSGKTTLLSHITGLLAPTEGDVRVLGLEPHKAFKKLWKKLGVLLQSLEEQLIGPTVRDDIAFSLKNAGWPRDYIEKRVEEVMADLKITHLADKIPHYLSGGEQQKVALAGALALRPQLLILDEPFSRVDQKSKKELVTLLKEINHKYETAILFTAHDLSHLPSLAHTVYIMKQGELLARGRPEEVLLDLPLLKEADLEPPSILELVGLLRKRNIEVPYTLDPEELADMISRLLDRELSIKYKT